MWPSVVAGTPSTVATAFGVILEDAQPASWSSVAALYAAPNTTPASQSADTKVAFSYRSEIRSHSARIRIMTAGAWFDPRLAPTDRVIARRTVFVGAISCTPRVVGRYSPGTNPVTLFSCNRGTREARPPVEALWGASLCGLRPEALMNLASCSREIGLWSNLIERRRPSVPLTLTSGSSVSRFPAGAKALRIELRFCSSWPELGRVNLRLL